MELQSNHQSLELVLDNQISKKTPYQDKTRDIALIEVWGYMEKFWKLKDETPEYFLLTRTNDTLNGHIWIALILGWWSLFIPNLVYHLAMQKKQKIFKSVRQ